MISYNLAFDGYPNQHIIKNTSNGYTNDNPDQFILVIDDSVLVLSKIINKRHKGVWDANRLRVKQKSSCFDCSNLIYTRKKKLSITERKNKIHHNAVQVEPRISAIYMLFSFVCFHSCKIFKYSNF